MDAETERLAQWVYGAICRADGIKAKEIAGQLHLERKTVNHLLYSSPLMRELCWKDRDDRWHSLIRQTRPHGGLFEFAGWYGTFAGFAALSEEEWLVQLTEGCDRIGRSLNDKRGLFHSFRDCGAVMRRLTGDLRRFLGDDCLNWELVFELRIKKSRHIRIYADVLVVSGRHVFSLEFKMKDAIDPDEVSQAAKYVPALEIIFGPNYDVVPVLVLTAARDLFRFAPLPGTEAEIVVCSGDMLFNAFDEYLGFLE